MIANIAKWAMPRSQVPQYNEITVAGDQFFTFIELKL